METDRKCFLCGRNGADDPLDKHHIFPGPYRQKSDEYGLTVYLCHNRCHIFGKMSVHQNAKTMNQLKRYGQLKAMKENHWSENDFIREFGKNYL